MPNVTREPPHVSRGASMVHQPASQQQPQRPAGQADQQALGQRLAHQAQCGWPPAPVAPHARGRAPRAGPGCTPTRFTQAMNSTSTARRQRQPGRPPGVVPLALPQRLRLDDRLAFAVGPTPAPAPQLRVRLIDGDSRLQPGHDASQRFRRSRSASGVKASSRQTSARTHPRGECWNSGGITPTTV